MKTKHIFLMVGIFLVLVSGGLCQPVITDQPQSQVAMAGTNVTFTVTATGNGLLDYQWHFGTSDLSLSGQTNAALVLTNVQTSNAGNYTVVITNADGAVTSAVAALTVLIPVSITAQPSSHSVIAGTSTTLSVLASGTQPLAYQWSFGAQPVAGATHSSVTFASVQFSNAGPYSVIITNPAGSISSQIAMLTVVPSTLFTRVTNGPVATDLGQSGSCVWADFHNDGFLDLYIAQYFSKTNFFYRNNGDGTFTRITQGDFLVTSGYNFGVSAVDYDNDGYLDLIVATAGSSPTPRRSVLFHNNGDFTFDRVSAGGVTNQLGWFPSAQWADYDNDGFVDLLITQSDSTESGVKTNLLWHNNGDGSFVGVAGSPLVSDLMAGWGLFWSDYDNDGLIDVLVTTSDNGHNYLYHNSGGGAFTRVSNNVIVTDAFTPLYGTYADWGDYDNDGLPDLFVVDGGGGRNHLYHNNGGGKFSNITTGPMLTPPPGSNGRASAWGDYDNDGYLDLLVGYWDRNVIYRNNHDGTFTEVPLIAPALDRLADPTAFFNTRAWVDYDNDGFLDLFITAASFTNLRIPNLLYHNAGNTNGWLEVKCVGTASSCSAIGAKIRVKATIGGKSFWQARELSSGGGWNLAKPLVAHFGLGDATNVESLRIEWPSGIVQTLTNVAPRQMLTVVEHQVYSSPAPSFGVSTILPSGVQLLITEPASEAVYVLEASTDLAKWTKVMAHKSTGATFAFTNAGGGSYTQRFYRVVVP
jgi:hypothetical protein